MHQIDRAIQEAIKKEVGPSARPDIRATSIPQPVERHPGRPRQVEEEPPHVVKDIKMDIPEKLRPIGIEDILPEVIKIKIGRPPESIKLPKKMKPIEVKTEERKKPKEVLPPPSTEIDLDELIESIVNERIEKLEIKIKNINSKISKIEENIEIIKETKKEEKPVANTMSLQKVEDLENKLDNINSRIKSLGTAFKSLSHYFKK